MYDYIIITSIIIIYLNLEPQLQSRSSDLSHSALGGQRMRVSERALQDKSGPKWFSKKLKNATTGGSVPPGSKSLHMGATAMA